MNWVINRLKEPSTWSGIGTLLAMLAGYLTTQGAGTAATVVSALAAALAAALGVVTKEKS